MLLHLLFERMRDYRFFYRDLDEITSRNRKLAARFAKLMQRGENTVIELFRGLVAAGAMRASEREIASLASNVTLVSTYWMSFQRIGAPHGGDAVTGMPPWSASIARPIKCWRSSRLTWLDDGRTLIEQLGENYL